jgi:DNA polymerase III subunit alpha
MGNFIHLHVHTQYSVLDGLSDISGLVKKAVAFGMPAVAITDHGNMFGVKEFHKAAKKEGIKPIIGCEVYVARGSRFDRKKEDMRGNHLILLAKNKKGYKNLMKLVSLGYTEGFYGRPRIDKEALFQYREGLIVSSACIGGEIPRAVRQNEMDEARKIILQFKEWFADDFYLELQRHQTTDPGADQDVYQKQMIVNKGLIQLARELDVKLIATNDVHFINAEDAEAHDRLICLNTGSDLDATNRMRYTKQEWFKSPDEMAGIFSDIPEVLQNTIEIAEKVESFDIDSVPVMPNFSLPHDFVIEPDGLKKSLCTVVSTQLKQIKNEELKAKAVNDFELLQSELESANDLQTITSIVCKGYENIPDLPTAFETSRQQCYLVYLTFEGAKKQWETLTPEVEERLNFELETIERMGFPGYFLIVWDFLRAAREMGVWVGPGRGSAAGSAVAFCLHITDIDPIKYDLLFERFLNPDRISMPDIDIDFDDDGRARVLQYVVDKYGKEKVAHIITFGTMAAKSSIRDVARVQKLPLPEADKLAKLVPDGPNVTLKQAYEDVKELSEARKSDNALIAETLRYAETLEGAVRNTGIHACGIIIGRDDLTNFIPLSITKDKETETDVLVTQFEGKFVEDVGLLKMDFLGLKTLSILKDAVELIKKSRGIDIDIYNVPLDDKETYELYSRGDTTGTFQFESDGMKKYLRELKPSKFEDLIAMNALYRPGPMDYIPKFIARKHGREKVEYDVPVMEKRLNDTYGITVYQEQVMLLSRDMAGFSRGDSDKLRKAMGKKQKDVMESLKVKFVEGCKKNGIEEPKVLKVWSDWESFAEYAFNKSHSTCYSYVAYQTAYLKAHYPAEFMAAVLSRSLSDIKKITVFMDECKRMGIKVLGPDVNESYLTFTVNKEGNIRFGLGAIKGVGEAAVLKIIEERDKNGNFTSIYDFIERVNLQSVNKKNIEALATAGGFDSFGITRCHYFAADSKGVSFTENLLRYGNKVQSEKNATVVSLFGNTGTSIDKVKPEVPYCEEWSTLEMLDRERELIGIYLSAHPLDNYKLEIDSLTNATLSQFSNLQALMNKDVSVACMVSEVKQALAKNGNPYGAIVLEDYSDSYKMMLFGKDWLSFGNFFTKGYSLLIRGKIQLSFRNEPELKIKTIHMLPSVREELVKSVQLRMPLEQLTDNLIEQLQSFSNNSNGKLLMRFFLYDQIENVSIEMFSRTQKININNEFVSFLNNNPEIEYKLK